ncbi:Hpt domain-containing protein [Arthrobacter agilis]|uniref:Hpt domain-containing protein n=1 Tax=Arthrobacter agilis TaxID=37921 RepID=UPI002365CC4E|nr:Hpt domain-containing protein [Arthrobacter agilis]WDF32967.1 Hpt domain-containing protein [Arthrobacter agilis]
MAAPSGGRREHATPGPLLAPDVLAEMDADFGDPAVVVRFVRDFRSILPSRVERLERRLDDGDPGGAEDAALSLATSSAMVGAVRLERISRSVQHALEEDGLDAARRSLDPLRLCATETLGEMLRLWPDSASS